MTRVISKLFFAGGLLGYFLGALIVANLRVARDVVSPLRKLKPGIVAIPLDVETDAEITLLANLITLTPGTLSLDVSADRKTLYIHAMKGADPARVRASVKRGLERRVRELFS